jgi:hypothetical protein
MIVARTAGPGIALHRPHPHMPAAHEPGENPENNRTDYAQNDQGWYGCHSPFNHKDHHGPERDLDVGHNDPAVVIGHFIHLQTTLSLVYFFRIGNTDLSLLIELLRYTSSFTK